MIILETNGFPPSPHQNEGYSVDACLIQIKASLTDFVQPVSHSQQKRVKVQLTSTTMSLAISTRIHTYKHTVCEKRKTRIDPISKQKYLVTRSITPKSPQSVVHHTSTTHPDLPMSISTIQGKTQIQSALHAKPASPWRSNCNGGTGRKS